MKVIVALPIPAALLAKLTVAALLTLSLPATLPLAGCHAVSATTPSAALIPNATNSFDSAAYLSITGARSLAKSWSAGSKLLTLAERSALNSMIDALNSADIVYAAYHAGTATQAQLQASLDKVSAAQSSVQSGLSSATAVK